MEQPSYNPIKDSFHTGPLLENYWKIKASLKVSIWVQYLVNLIWSQQDLIAVTSWYIQYHNYGIEDPTTLK